MQSYLKYKDYYDRKAKAALLKEKGYCFVLQPKADSQASKIPFREYWWIDPFVVQTVLSNDNYIVRRLNTNKTQILHRIRLKKFVPNASLGDKYDGEKLQPDNEIVEPQDDLYTISWEVDFEYELFEPRKDDWTDVATRRLTDAEDGSVENYVIENERGSASETESHSKRSNEDDTARMKHERSRVIAKTCRHYGMKRLIVRKMKMTSLMIYKKQEMFQIEAQILPCPEYLKKKTLKKTLALEEGATIFDLTPTPTLLMNTDTSQKLELAVPFPLLLVRVDIYFLLGTFLTYFVT